MGHTTAAGGALSRGIVSGGGGETLSRMVLSKLYVNTISFSNRPVRRWNVKTARRVIPCWTEVLSDSCTGCRRFSTRKTPEYIVATDTRIHDRSRFGIVDSSVTGIQIVML